MDVRLDVLGLRMVTVPAGSVDLGDDRAGRRWQTALKPYRLSHVPVTQALYRAFTGQSPSAFAEPLAPVENVSWLDAVSFCNALSRAFGLSEGYEIEADGAGATRVPGSLGYRLPSEAEWLHACRAGSRGPRYGELERIGWYKANSSGRPHLVGRKEPNAWGLYDMLGNVWEWCADQYDPQAHGPYRAFRGGGWADDERGCLATNRRRSHPAFRIDDLGFRLAQSVP